MEFSLLGMDILALELRKLGLKEKEAGVYLAALEPGHTSVQKIAEKAGVSRPTCHQIIKALEKRGLMSETKEKGKTYYTAESPDKLLGLLRLEKRALEEREREFIRIISALKARYYLGEKSEIRTYHGQSGIKFLTDDFSQTGSREIFVLSDSPVFLKLWQAKYEKIKKRLGRVKITEILTEKFSELLSENYIERKIIKSAVPGTLVIYDKIAYLPHPKKPVGLLIENQNLLELLRALIKTD